jgi:lipoprotein-anchoring transpeptidase ErfK/SrfK
MMRRFGVMLLTLPAAAAISAGSAQAQYYPAQPQPYYRGSPPSAAQDRLPPPGYWLDEDDDDAPVTRRPRYGQLPPQGQPGSPRSILPYPVEAQATPAPAPAFASPTQGHQLDPQQPTAAAPADPDAIRPPASIGTGPGVAPAQVRPSTAAAPAGSAPVAASILPPEDQPEVGQPKELPANLKKQLVDYSTKEPAGTIIVDTPNTYLYLVLGGGKAMRYGIGVGREGFTWAGTERVSRMSEWPDWHPPSEMIERQPYLPRFMAGGPGNPLGARALYLGKTLYRIHGTNQPSTIGTTVSSGCIRLINEDVEDLFSRVQVGSRVVVLPGKPPETVASGTAPAPEPANPMAPPTRTGSTAVSGSPLPPVR